MNNMVVVTSQKKSKALKYYYHEGQSSYIVFPVTIKSEVWFTATSFCPHLATHPPLFRCTVTLRRNAATAATAAQGGIGRGASSATELGPFHVAQQRRFHRRRQGLEGVIALVVDF